MFDLLTRTVIGCVLSRSLLASFGLDHIGFGWKPSIISLGGQDLPTLPSSSDRDRDRGALHIPFPHLLYYEIEGQYYHVFRDSRNSLSILFQYPDQRFIALFMKDALGLRSQSLRPPPRPDTTRMITSLITVLPAYTGTKRHHQ